MLVNLVSWLKWSESDAAGSKPTGTITYTIGSDTCKLDIETKSFSCSGESTKITRNDKRDETDPDNIKAGYEFEVINALLSSNTADRVKAEYSGDAIFNPSSSIFVLFKTIPTNLVISNNSKSSTGLIGLKVVLDWVDTPPDQMLPGGTIKLTSGTAVCSFRVSDSTDSFTDCAGTISVDTSADKARTYTITGMNMGSGVGDTIKADYSGDVMFIASASNTLSFNKVNTELVWEDDHMPYKHGNMLANLTSWLKWSEKDAAGSEPTGTITFTIGSDTCKLDVVTKSFSCSGQTTSVTRNDKKDETDPDNIKDGFEFVVIDAVLSSNTADRIKAEYSGDAIFNGSSSTIVLFKTIPTTLVISDNTKSSTGLIGLKVVLNWVDTPPDQLKPTGTIKLTSGSAVCSFTAADNTDKFNDCAGSISVDTSTAKTWTYTITGMDMGSGVGDTIKADYSGDVMFTASASNTLSFKKINTELVWENDRMPYKHGDMLVNLVSWLKWSEDEAGLSVPTGTITFTIGSDTCKLDIETKAFNCSGLETRINRNDKKDETDPDNIKDGYEFEVFNALLSSKNADRVKAEYSGDAVFNPSSSVTVLFRTIETTLTLYGERKTSAGLVNVTTELAWTDDQPAGTSPSGTIKLTSGDAVCTIDLATNSFKEPDCTGTITPSGSQDGKKRIYVIENMKIGDGSGTTLKADYSGDDIFMASVSNTVDFNKVNTTLEITNAYKPSAGMANVDITLSWLPGQVDAGTKPTGTITFTIGSDTCKLDITTKAFNCAGQSTSGLEPDPARSTDTSLVWSIKNIVLSSDTADRVKAEYSGDAVFNPSSSLIVMFQTIPTTTTLSNQSKTPEGLVNVTAELSWTDTPPDSVTPHGQIKFTSGSASCTYSLDTEKLIDCEGTVTPAQPQGEKSRIYTVTGLEIGDGKGTTIKAEYSGDGLFLASASDTLDFNKVDTMLKITDGTKSRENVIGLTTKITWDNQSTSDPNPKGTITYTSGSASCVLNLDTMNFERCSGEASIVNGVITITNMKMNGTPEDNIYAVYSGDNRYNGSTSPTFWFASIEKIDPLLEIVKITDESGVEHSSYFTPGQTVRVETNMAGALDDPAPGGTVTISIDTSTCTITLPQTACLITLPKVVGSTRVVASYGGDANYNPDTAEKAINIQEPKDLTLEIDKIVDDQGVEQEEFGRGQQVTISVNLKDYDPAEIPTGPVTVKVGNSTCTIMRPDESSCKLKLPDVARTYEVTAEYAGNTYYNKAEAEPKEVKVGKYDITFEITAITNIETNDMGNTVYIEQPYYVYDRTAGAGELVRVCAELKDADHGDPSQTVTITVKDEAHDDGATLTTFTVGAKCGTFNVRKYTGTITLTAYYPGDDNYVSKKAVKTLDVQNRIKPVFTLYPAYTHYDDPGYGIISFQLSHDSDIPDQYEGISLFEDNSKAKAAEKVQSVTFTFRGTKYQYFMLQNVLYHIIDEDHRELVTDAEITVENGIYTIDNVPFAAGTDNKITAVYDGNRYFYGATDDDSIYKEDGGYTIVNLSDILKIDNPLMGTTNGHMFLKADLSYSEYVYEQHGVKPQGSLVIKAGTTEKTCVFVLDTGSFTLQDDTSRSCGDITEDDGVIHFVIRDLDISPKSADTVTVQFKKYSEQSLYEDSEIAEGEIVTEARPEVTFVETETETGTQTGAKKTSAETADLVFTIENTGDLTKAYEVYDFVQIGSKSAEEGAVWATCAFDNKTYHWKDSTCSGEITVSGDTYTIRNFTGIIAEDDTLCSVKLMNDDTDITDPEFPSDTAEYWHEKMATTLTITEPLKYKGTNSAHAFLEFSINYNESERAKWGDVYPTGTLYFSSVDDTGSAFTRCYIDLKTGESEGCSGVILDPVWWLESETGHVLLNARIWPDESKVSLSYNGDAYFEPAPATAYVPYTPESPEIVINNAMHLPDGKVYADFTITGMGELAEKYRVNHALRFRSNSSGKTCTFNFVNDAFDPGCEGTLVVSGDQFTLKDLTNLYTNGDTEFSVAVVSEYLEESEYVHKEKPYSKLPDTITLSNVLKMMTSHGFVTVDFGYESEISARYGISPTGTFTFSSSAGSCTYDLETKTANGCTVEWDESASSSGNIRLLVKNLPVSGGVSTVSAVYGSDDPFFDEKTADRRVEADLHSVIRLTEALKTTLTKANVKFVISNLDDRYAKIYGSFFEQISLRSNPGHAGYIDISSIIKGDAASGTASLYPGEGSVTWTRDGEGYYTFYVQNWTGTIDRDDEQCTAALMSHTYLEESEYPKDSMDFKHRTDGEVTLEVSDVLAAQTNHVYLTVDMDYDADIADSYDELPSGTLTITGNNGAAERVCTFDLRDGTFELEDDPSISCGTFVLDEPGHHAVFVVRNYETGDSAVTSVSVKYSGNDFFAESNEAAGTAVEETPSIDINAPLVSRNNRVAYVILTVDLGALTKQYGVYTNYRLDSYGEVPQSTSIGHTTCRYYLSDPGSNPCQAEEVVVEGSTLIFKKLDVDYGYNEHSQNKLKVSLENNEWTSDHRNYPYTEKSWWHGISPIMTAYDAFRYSDFHAGLTAKLSVSAAVMRYTDLYDLYPTGTMVFSSGNATCTCNLSDGTCTDGCIATVTEEGSLPITMKVRNLRGTSLGTQVKAEFKRDEFFYYAENTADLTEVIPSITIQSARKTSNTSANLTVLVKGNDHKDLYGDLYNRILLATHDGAYTEIDISGILAGSETSGTIPGTGGFEKVEWTRNGNNVTFIVTDWRENITAEDTQCVAWLSNSDTTVLPLAHSPISDPEPFSIQKGSVTLSVIGNALRSRNDNAFLDIKLDYDPDVAAAFRKPAGTLNLTARSGITYTDDCTFDLNNGPEGAVTCTTGSAEIIDYDESAHYATIRIRKFYIYRAPSISVNGSGDDLYQYTYASASVTEEIPVVHLNTAVKGVDSSGDPVGYLKFMIKTGPLTEKFGPYTRVELYTGPDSGLPVHHDTGFDLDHNEGNFEPPVTGDISVDYDEGSCTYTYMVRNMKGLILGSDKYMRVGLRGDEVDSLERSEILEFEKIPVSIDLSDLIIVVDGQSKSHAFGTISFILGDPAETLDLWPGGWMQVISSMHPDVISGRLGHVNVADGSLAPDARQDFGEVSFTPVQDTGAHAYQILMKNKSVLSTSRYFTVQYNGDSSYQIDPAFEDAVSNSEAYTSYTPVIRITDARKFPLITEEGIKAAADMSFSVTHLDSLEDPWHVVKAIRVSTGSGSRYSDIDLATNQFTDGSGEVRRTGNTFEVMNWTNFSSEEDMSITVSLVSDYTDFTGQSKTENLRRTVPRLSVSDMMAMANYRFLTIDMNYTDNGAEPTGEIKITANDATCTYNLSSTASTCTYADILVTKEPGHIKILVCGWTPSGNTFQSAYINYGGDTYYSATQSPTTNSVTRVSLPRVKANSANRRSLTAQFTIEGYDAHYSKYPIITGVGLKASSTASAIEYGITVEDLPVTYEGITLDRTGDEFYVTNFRDLNNYPTFTIILRSQGRYWSFEDVSDSIPITSGFGSAAPVSISVGDFQPIGGQ